MQPQRAPMQGPSTSLMRGAPPMQQQRPPQGAPYRPPQGGGQAGQTGQQLGQMMAGMFGGQAQQQRPQLAAYGQSAQAQGARPQQGLGGAMGQAAAGMFGGQAQQRPQQSMAQQWGAAARPQQASAGGASDYMRAQQGMAQQQRPAPSQAQMAGALGGGMLFSDEEGKRDVKDYNEGSGINWQDYASDDDGEKKSGGGLGGMLSGIMSDRNSKQEINRLEGANAALTSALSGADAQRQRLADFHAQQSTTPSRASFPDSAHQVAAQNQAMGGNPFAINMQQPNLEELDAAYARLGQGG